MEPAMISRGWLRRRVLTACEQKCVRRVIHISAVGAGPGGSTALVRTKAATERELLKHDLDWLILRPGPVIASGVYGGTVAGRRRCPQVTPIVATRKPIHAVHPNGINLTLRLDEALR
jgi:uncharacterized protein YbjT (DUF2867 family)